MKKIIFSVFILFASLFCFTGCYDAIFQAIRDEVELESATISGFINGIARYNVNADATFDATKNFENQYLFSANGKISYKKATILEHGAWHDISGNGLPSSTSYAYFDGEFDGMYLYNVAADKDYVYVIGFKAHYDSDNSRNVPSDYKIYYSKPTDNGDGTLSFTWKEVTGLSTILSNYQSDIDSNDDDNYGMALSIHLFGTNAVNPAHRAVFLRVGGNYAYLSNARNNTSNVYKLNGETYTEVAKITYADSAEVVEPVETTETPYYNELSRGTLSAVWFDDGVHFMNYINANTNEGTLSGGTALSEPTYVYFPYSSNICYFRTDYYSSNKDACTNIFKGTTEPTSSDVSSFVSHLDVDQSVISMAVTNNSILLGSGRIRGTGNSVSSSVGDGVYRVLTVDGAITETASFTTNADDVMVSPYIVRSLICADPSLDEEETSMYSSLDYPYTESSVGSSIKNRGLWSYYKSRGNWNRE